MARQAEPIASKPRGTLTGSRARANLNLTSRLT